MFNLSIVGQNYLVFVICEFPYWVPTKIKQFRSSSLEIKFSVAIDDEKLIEKYLLNVAADLLTCDPSRRSRSRRCRRRTSTSSSTWPTTLDSSERRKQKLLKRSFWPSDRCRWPFPGMRDANKLNFFRQLSSNRKCFEEKFLFAHNGAKGHNFTI